jgi:hypothetical protein
LRLSQQGGVDSDTGITKIFEPIDAFVGFLEHGSELRLELGSRTPTPCGAIVVTDGPGRSSQLTPDFLCFGRVWQTATEFDHGQREQSRPFSEVTRRHMILIAGLVPSSFSGKPIVFGSAR